MSLTLLIAAPKNEGGIREWDRYDSDESMPPNILTAKKEADRKWQLGKVALSRYYAKLGFKPLGSFLGRWNGFICPSVKKICPHLFQHY